MADTYAEEAPNEIEEPASQDAPEDEGQEERARKAFIIEWSARIRGAKKFHEDAFKRMRADEELAFYGAYKAWRDAGSYTVPVVGRHISQAVAALYAKDPQVTAKRKPRIKFRAWDGKPESLIMALQSPDDPMSREIIMEYQTIQAEDRRLMKLGKALEILFDYFISEHEPNFKRQMKQLVRRTKTVGLGYIKLGFQRAFEPNPDISQGIADATEQLAGIKRLMEEAKEGDIEPYSAQAEELRQRIKALQSDEMMLVREGPVFDFPRAYEIIVDPACRQIEGFVGAGWIAHERRLTPDRVKEVYGVEVKTGGFTSYKDKESSETPRDEREAEDQKGAEKLCVWEVYDKRSGLTFTIADGCMKYLSAPETPRVWIDGFWPVEALVFNDCEYAEQIYPMSDVRALEHPQLEYNRSRQALRIHRIANTPKYLAPKGKLDEEDKSRLANSDPHSVIELNAVETGRPLSELLDSIRHPPVDPALYDTTPVMDDILRSVGTQEAQIGGMAGATATESSIAEGARQAGIASNIDDLDDFLSRIARKMSQIFLRELSPETVAEIVGPGVEWPQASLDEIAKEIYLEVRAGSSGRPNRAAELANLERATPYLLQTPEISPWALARRFSELVDIDPEELRAEGMPSIVAQNAAAGRGPSAGPAGGTERDPGAQGGAGATNAPNPQERQPGAQAAYPAPGDFSG